MINYNLTYELRPLRSGRFGIRLKYTINGKRKFKTTGIILHSEKQWDDKKQIVRQSVPGYEKINYDLDVRRQNLLSVILKAQAENKKTVSIFTGAGHSLRIKDFAEGWIEDVSGSRSPETIGGYRARLKKLVEFAGNDVTFDDVDINFLKQFEKHIRGKGTTNIRVKNSTYIFAVFRVLRTWFNEAIKKGVTTNYPFKFYEPPKIRTNEKDFLEVDELFRLKEYANAVTGRKKEAAVYFLLGCLTGLRVSDWMSFDIDKNIKPGYITLRANKNGEPVAMPLFKHINEIIRMVKETPLAITEPVINGLLKVIAKELKIKKHLSTHVGRKTFAITMCANKGISCETCATLMGISVDTCMNSYYRVTPYKIESETRKAWGGM